MINKFIDVIKVYKGKKRLGKALFLSGFSQMVSSLTNFAIIFYLLRVMNKFQFGQYNLGFASILLISGLVCAWIVVQFVVNLPDQPSQRRTAYALHHGVAIMLVGSVLIGVAFVLQTTIKRYFLPDNANVLLIIPVAVASGLYALRDLLMRFAFAERRESVVLGSTVVVAIAIVGVFSVMMIFDHSIDAASALYGYAIGQGAGALQALLVFKLPWQDINLSELRRAFRDSWTGGRWNILSGVVYNIRSQAHNFIVAPLLGITALAELNAARVLVTPAVMAIPPVIQILMPRLAEKRALGSEALSKPAMLSIAVLSLVTVVYSIILIANIQWILPLALGKTYGHVGPLVVAWCIVTVMLALRNGLTVVLEVAREFRNLLVANIGAAIGAVLLAVSLSRLYGGVGAVYALAMAEALLCTMLCFIQISLRRTKNVSRLQQGFTGRIHTDKRAISKMKHWINPDC